MAESAAVEKLLQDVLRERHIPGELILSFVSGSYAFNLSTPTSDVDAFGVYAADPRALLALRSSDAPDVIDRSGPECEIDYVLYEARRFCQLLMKGNPKVIEPLFSDKLAWRSPLFEELVAHRGTFLNIVTLKQYLGYAAEKLRCAAKPNGDKNDPKKQMYHALRLALEAEHICCGREPKVFLEGEDREEIMAIRQGRKDLSVVAARTQAILDSIYAKIDATGLPEMASVSVMNEWLWRLYGISSVPLPVQQCPHDTAVADVYDALIARGIVVPRLIFCGLSGSALHGVALPDSSPDRVAIYVQPLRSALSVEPYPDVACEGVAGSSVPTTASGLLAVELRAAVSAALSGNHRILEALFAPESSWLLRTPVWEQLVARRAAFLGHTTLSHYLGLAEGQLKAAETALSKGSSDLDRTAAYKRIAHASRLVSEARHIVQRHPPAVVVPAENRDVQCKLLRGSISAVEAKKEVDATHTELTGLRCAIKSALADTATIDGAQLSNWLVSVRFASDFATITTPL